MRKGAAGIGKPASAVPEEYRTQPPTLASAGIDKKLSARAQKIAALPEPAFEAHLNAAKKQAADALRMTTAEKQQRRTEREAELGAKQLAWSTKIYGVIYADPPGGSRCTRATRVWIATPRTTIRSMTLDTSRPSISRPSPRLMRPVPVGDRAHAGAGPRDNEGVGLRVQDALRLGEGSRRHGLLGA